MIIKKAHWIYSVRCVIMRPLIIQRGLFMRLKNLVFICLLGLFSPLFAANKHLHAGTNEASQPSTPNALAAQQSPSQTKFGWPGYCEIEIINNSYDDVRVYGVFDDGIALEPFNVYSYESPHYISLYYYGYCHNGMDLYVDTFYGAHIYAGYVSRYSTIRIVPSWFGGKQQSKATVEVK